MKIVNLSSLIVFAILFCQLVQAEEASQVLPKKTCVASMITEAGFNEQLQESSLKLLDAMGYDRANPRFDYKVGSANVIKECLEGSYEEVIIVAHSAEVTAGHQSIVYHPPYSSDPNKWEVLSDRLFGVVQLGPNLREIILTTCYAEKVIIEYPALKKVSDQHGINLRVQPSSLTFSLASGGKYDGVRDENLLHFVLAEASQDEKSDTIYCLFRTQLTLIGEHGQSACLRNHFQVRYDDLLSIGMKSSTKFLRLRPQQKDQLGVFEVEAAILGGIDMGIKEEPVNITTDSLGFSVGVFPKIRLTPVRL